MSKLYYTESGHSMPNLAEELTTFRRARKVLTLPPTSSPASLYFIARAHEGSNLPLYVSVNGTPLPFVTPQLPWHTWYELSVGPGLLRAGDNVFEFWTDSTAMNSWALGLEAGHADPNSFVSDDSGRSWRSHHMAYLNVIRAEYVVRVRLAEGDDPAPPPIVFNDPDDPRLDSLRAIMPAQALDQGLTKLERLRAISTWLASSWEHTPAAPDLGVINSPWGSRDSTRMGARPVRTQRPPPHRKLHLLRSRVRQRRTGHRRPRPLRHLRGQARQSRRPLHRRILV